MKAGNSRSFYAATLTRNVLVLLDGVSHANCPLIPTLIQPVLCFMFGFSIKSMMPSLLLISCFQNTVLQVGELTDRDGTVTGVSIIGTKTSNYYGMVIIRLGISELI